MSSNGYDSPAGVDAPLNYISVEDYKWPTPTPVKRARLDEKERRRRHCECQKRFLARKQREFEQLPKQVARLELQLKLAQAIMETRKLEMEHSQLSLQLAALDCVAPSGLGLPIDAVLINLEEKDSDCEQIVQSLDVESILAELDLP